MKHSNLFDGNGLLFMVAGSWSGTAAAWSATVWDWAKIVMSIASFVLTLYAIYDYHLKVTWKKKSELRDKGQCPSLGECANIRIAKKLEGINEKSI
jgi:hypothetical protein